MVSRIIITKRKKACPNSKDVKGRCLKFFNIMEGSRCVRYFVKEESIEPLIAKGNKFDGVKAVW